jgi:hypothetical protein
MGSPAAAHRAVDAVGALSLVLHLAFWLAAWRSLPGSFLSAFACMLMLYVYGMWAGVMLGRVPQLGVDYLWQHRYVAFFQLANVALALQWLASARAGRTGAVARPGTPVLLASLAVLACVATLQVALSTRAWESAPHLRIFQQHSASALFCLSTHAPIDDLECRGEHVVCGWGPEVRRRLVGLLAEESLNVFSPEVQARYGFVPDPARDMDCVGTRPVDGR